MKGEILAVSMVDHEVVDFIFEDSAGEFLFVNIDDLNDFELADAIKFCEYKAKQERDAGDTSNEEVWLQAASLIQDKLKAQTKSVKVNPNKLRFTQCLN